MKKVVLLGAAGILVCAFFVVMGTYNQEAAADDGRDKSTLKKEVEILKKKNRPIQASCPFMYYFDGRPGYDLEEDCHANGPTDCAAEWDPYSSHNPVGRCNNNGCQRQGGGECDSASVADYLNQCYYNVSDEVWYAECRCHCWEDVK